MAGFADYLSLVVFRMPVEDRTSLPGEFDFNMEWTPDASQFNGKWRRRVLCGKPRRSFDFHRNQRTTRAEAGAEYAAGGTPGYRLRGDLLRIEGIHTHSLVNR